MSIKILGTGSSLPKQVITNDYLSTIMETNDEWISSRTGIRSRRLVTEETTTSMAVEASLRALKNSKVAAEDIDMIILATISPDQVMPNTACEVQKHIGAVNATCFDLNAACSGFLYALNTAAVYIKANMCQNVLVIGVETLSKIMDWNDRGTCVLFGDGAGAVVVTKDENAVYEMTMGSDGSKGQVLFCDGRKNNNPLVSNKEETCFVHMDGQEVFKFAVTKVPESICQVAKKAHVELSEIKYFVLHQANEKILKSVCRRLHVGMDHFPMNLDQCGNTSSATIPLLLDEMNQKGMLQPNDKIILCGFGGGLTWGSSYLQW